MDKIKLIGVGVVALVVGYQVGAWRQHTKDARVIFAMQDDLTAKVLHEMLASWARDEEDTRTMEEFAVDFYAKVIGSNR